MTEKEFQRLLIEMVKRGNNPNKAKILALLERSSLSCDKTSDFTYGWFFRRNSVGGYRDVKSKNRSSTVREYGCNRKEEIC